MPADPSKFSYYFNKSTARVNDACSQLDEHYARPVYRNTKQHFEERPIVSTFVTVFTTLSLVPIASFFGAASFVFLTFTLISLISASLAALAVILTLFTFLVLVLSGILLASIFLTGAALSSYALLRFALHIQREGPSLGISEWSQETKEMFISRKPATKREERPTENGFSDINATVIAAIKNGPIENQRRGTEEEELKVRERESNEAKPNNRKRVEEGEHTRRNSDATLTAEETGGGFEMPG